MKFQLNDVEARACRHCSLLHPLTDEFWYFGGKQVRCKIAERRKNERNYPTAIVRNSRNHDKKKGRYDPQNYIDKAWVLSQQEAQKDKCHYCGTLMLYGLGINRQTNREALTVERLDNNRGHNKDNCVLCHKKCQKVNHPRNKK